MKDFFRFIKGILLRPTTSDNTFRKEGAVFVDSADSKVKAFLGGSYRKVVTHDQPEVLYNKTLDASTSVISDLSDVNLADDADIQTSKLLDGTELAEAVVFFTDTDITGAEAEELTDGSETALHIHDDRYYTETELDDGQLDTRYYTETEIDSTFSDYTTTAQYASVVDGDSGADKIGSTTITDITGNTVQEQLEYIAEKALVSGSLGLPATTVTTDTTLDIVEHVYLVDSTTNSVTLTLPKSGSGAGEAPDGKRYEIKVLNITNEVKVITSDSQLIDGVSEFIFNSNNEVRQFLSDNNKWYIL